MPRVCLNWHTKPSMYNVYGTIYVDGPLFYQHHLKEKGGCSRPEPSWWGFLLSQRTLAPSTMDGFSTLSPYLCILKKILEPNPPTLGSAKGWVLARVEFRGQPKRNDRVNERSSCQPPHPTAVSTRPKPRAYGFRAEPAIACAIHYGYL